MAIFAILKPNHVITDVEEIFISVAQNRGHQAYLFTAKDVDFEQGTIQGTTLERGEIVQNFFDFPDVIQNRLAVKAEDKDVYLKLAEMIPFTSNRVGTKKEVDHKLQSMPEIQDYLIDVEECHDVDIIRRYLDKYHKVILKPVASNQGKGIFSLEPKAQGYLVKKLNESFYIAAEELSWFFETHIRAKHFSISPFFKSETVHGQTTVFRMHLTRGAGGQWKMIKFFPYININPNIDITNGMQGALITTREKMFLEQNYPNAHEKIQQRIRHLFKVFPLAFQKKYRARLDGLGLDLGIDQQGNIAIFEVNAGAGIGFMAYPVAKAQVEYYEWLKEHAKSPFTNDFLPIHLKRLHEKTQQQIA